MGDNDEWQRYCRHCGFTCGAKKVTSWQVHRFIRAPITNCNWVVAPTGSKRECCWTLSLWAIRVIFQFLSRLSLERRSKCKMINIPSEATEPQRVCPHLHSRPNRIQELLQWSSMLIPTSLRPSCLLLSFICLPARILVMWYFLYWCLPLTLCVHHIHLKWPAYLADINCLLLLSISFRHLYCYLSHSHSRDFCL